MKKTLFMETTEVPAERTAGEIISMLVASGANQVNTEYANGAIVGLRWAMRVSGCNVVFAMPARVAPVEKILLKRRTGMLDAAIRARVADQARRVAWRQLLRWTQAQMSMIECGMTEPGEVFFPYLQTPAGSSIFEAFKEQGMRMLPAPEVQ